MALVMWRYLWRVTAVHRSETDGTEQDRPPPLPADVAEGLQRDEAGVGPLLRRRYTVRITGASATPDEVIARFAHDPNCGAPSEVAVFEKVDGAGEETGVGDEFLIRMPGPWNGPVRVIGREEDSLRLATLPGHLEAGQIEFRCRTEDGELVFEIESWARSGDRLSHLLYTKLRLAKEMQLNMWVETCLGIARDAGGRARGGVRVGTRRVPEPATAPGVAGRGHGYAAPDSAPSRQPSENGGARRHGAA
ncbi:hypothetical protein GCM10009559_72730 [Pseudonocardia zijingensis]|uniref:DUF1990 domain-containing protein n=2 Tax=Pseudonocardia zijingensis TaxID=153376 RepID=A0ABP3YWP9_9PSEU